MKNKMCWYCEHFNYSNGWLGTRETAGNSFEISCNESKWYFDSADSTQEEFAEVLSSAENCKEYKELDLK